MVTFSSSVSAVAGVVSFGFSSGIVTFSSAVSAIAGVVSLVLFSSLDSGSFSVFRA